MVNLNENFVYVFAGYGFYTFVLNIINYLIRNRKMITERYFYNGPEEEEESTIIINDSSDDEDLLFFKKRKRN